MNCHFFSLQRPGWLVAAFARLLALAVVLTSANVASAQEIDFNKQIRPVLSKNCLACHGPDETNQDSDLRLDSFEAATDWAIVPGEPDESEVIARIESEDEGSVMPPAEHGHALSADEKALLRRWIAAGAEYTPHWAFVAPVVHPIPTTQFDDWAVNEIDHFILQKLEALAIAPSAPAEPHRLIRGVALDLTGLPPTQSQVDRYVARPTLETYEQIVDELLASPSYGEHWGAMWLDIARYADTFGYASDDPRTIWPWRDWVIDAFNQNMPYDQFSIEQLAGDLLPMPNESQILATAFHRNSLNNAEGGTNDEEFRVLAVKDRVNTTVNVWMGLTMRCAECHTHKYDPISQTEYYQFYDFFNQTADKDTNDDAPRLKIEGLTDLRKLAELDQLIAALNKKKASERNQRNGAETNESEANAADSKMAQIKAQRKALIDQRAAVAAGIQVPVMRELPANQQRETHVMIRGNFLAAGDKVSAAVPVAFHAMPESEQPNRLGVAHWLIANENPLTARVTVNRFWARIFGIGIVETEEDFGTQGTLPTHPELLDWLAIDFRDHGWDVKRLLKQMVMSATYRQTNQASADRLAADPRNLFYSRGPRVRLTAEVVRDQALAVSGLLSSKMHGPPVYPPSPIKKIVSSFTQGMTWTTSTGEDRYRRAIYTYLKRTQPHPLFETFDMATREVCSMRRLRTNTPLQSFMTLNDETFIECAQTLAKKMLEHAEDVDQQIKFGLESALLRPATEEQLQTLRELYDQTLPMYVADLKSAKKMSGAETSSATAPENLAEKTSETATLTVVANVILNLDAFLTK